MLEAMSRQNTLYERCVLVSLFAKCVVLVILREKSQLNFTSLLYTGKNTVMDQFVGTVCENIGVFLRFKRFFYSVNVKYADAQQRLTTLEARDRKLNKHSVQLEELRSLQEAFTKEKNAFINERDNENQWQKQKRLEIDKESVRFSVKKFYKSELNARYRFVLFKTLRTEVGFLVKWKFSHTF